MNLEKLNQASEALRQSKDFTIYNNVDLLDLYNKEQAAILICGSQLIDCYTIGELVDSLMLDAFGKIFPGKKYFVHMTKKKAKLAYEKNKLHITSAMQYNDPNYGREFADFISFEIWDDIKKLLYAMELQGTAAGLGKYAKDYAYIEFIRILIDMSIKCYNETLDIMKEMYKPVNYHSWYYHVRPDDVYDNWMILHKAFCKFLPNTSFDPNKSVDIHNGIKIIINKLNDTEMKRRAIDEADNYVGNNKETADALEKAYELFGLLK